MIIIYHDVSSEYLKLSILGQEVNLDLKMLVKDMLYPLPIIHEEPDREYTSSRLKNVSQVVRLNSQNLVSTVYYVVGFPGHSDGKESVCNTGHWVQSLCQVDPLGKGMVTHHSILAWKIPWTEESGGL